MDGHVFAHNPPKSTEQAAYTQARVAQLVAQRREQRRSLDISNDQLSLTSTRSHSSTTSSPGKYRESGTSYRTTSHQRDDSGEGMEATRATYRHNSIHSLHSEANHDTLLDNPFELRHGRRYLRSLPYPLPCDLVEIQRQNLRTLLGCQVFGKPICFPNLEHDVPKKVLELGCGSGYWSAMAHEYFRSLGHPNVSFTGLDIAPVASDLRKQGVNWRFVQHDFHRIPWPFEDEEFDLIVLRDLSLALPIGFKASRHLDENIRVLREGGRLEIWESDLVIRSLLPHSLGSTAAATNSSQHAQERETAEQTATFPMTTGAPFAPAQNKHLVQANAWITEALDRRRFSPVPCARIAQLLIQEPDLGSIGVRRVAIPLGELEWERGESAAGDPSLERINSQASSVVDSAMSMSGGGDRRPSRARARKMVSSSSLSTSYSSSSSTSESSTTAHRDHHHHQHHAHHTSSLTPDQSALRRTALVTVLQLIESLEPLLKEVSGKSTDEWSTWWAAMTAELTDPARANLSGECLELGVWWATKISEDGFY